MGSYSFSLIKITVVVLPCIERLSAIPNCSCYGGIGLGWGGVMVIVSLSVSVSDLAVCFFSSSFLVIGLGVEASWIDSVH